MVDFLPYKRHFASTSWTTKRVAAALDFAENLVTLLVDIASLQKRTEPTGAQAHFWSGNLVSYE